MAGDKNKNELVPDTENVTRVVTIRVADKVHNIETNDQLEELFSEIEDTDDSIEIDIEGWWTWLSDIFMSVMVLIGELVDRVSITSFEGQSAFDAMLESRTEISLGEYDSAKKRLLIAAVVMHPDSIEPCCQRLKTCFEKRGLPGATKSSLVKDAMAFKKSLEREANQNLCFLADELNEIDVPTNLIVPQGYKVSMAGIKLPDGDVSAPVWIEKRQLDCASGKELVKICWMRDKQKRSLTVSKKTISESRLIVGLSEHGLPVNSNNASGLVQYLADFDTVNIEVLPASRVTSQLGYHKVDGKDCFVLPDQVIPADAGIEFYSDDPGITQLAQGFHTAGTLEEWVKAVNIAKDYPPAKFALFAALAPLLGVFLDFPNIIVDLCGRTSGGKTIVLRLAASIYGNPNEHDAGSVVHTWATTLTFLERNASFVNNIAVFLDDSKHAQDEQGVSKAIYLLGQGRGKGRATITGVQQTSTFRNNTISSGEKPLTDFGRNGGAHARVINLWGSPLGDFSPEHAETATAINSIVTSSYGHAALRFVNFILANEDKWDEWREEFQFEKDRYVELAKESDNQFAARMAPSLAAITMAVWLAHECFGFSFDYSDVVEDNWSAITAGAAQADLSHAAVQYIYEKVLANQDRFYSMSREGGNNRSVEYWGRWDASEGTGLVVPLRAAISLSEQSDDVDGVVDDDEAAVLKSASYDDISFIPSKLKELLDEGGFDSEAVIRTWNDKGWLNTDSDTAGRRTKKIRFGGKQANLVSLKWSAIREVCGF